MARPKKQDLQQLWEDSKLGTEKKKKEQAPQERIITSIEQLTSEERKVVEKEFYRNFNFMELYIPPVIPDTTMMKWLPIILSAINLFAILYIAATK